MAEQEVTLLKGNEAIAHAAIRCGVDAFFGYPITPQSEIIETLAALKPWETTGMVVLQAESEVASINMVYGGAGAQEEYLFRCSDYFRSLYQYGAYSAQYGIPHATDSYPLDRNYGGVYSHGVTIFRDKEANGYALLDTPWHVNFVAAAVSRLPYPCQQIPANDIPMSSVIKFREEMILDFLIELIIMEFRCLFPYGTGELL